MDTPPTPEPDPPREAPASRQPGKFKSFADMPPDDLDAGNSGLPADRRMSALWALWFGPLLVAVLSAGLAFCVPSLAGVAMGLVVISIIVSACKIALRAPAYRPGWLILLGALGYVVAQVVILAGIAFAACAAMLAGFPKQ